MVSAPIFQVRSLRCREFMYLICGPAVLEEICWGTWPFILTSNSINTPWLIKQIFLILVQFHKALLNAKCLVLSSREMSKMGSESIQTCLRLNKQIKCENGKSHKIIRACSHSIDIRRLNNQVRTVGIQDFFSTNLLKSYLGYDSGPSS